MNEIISRENIQKGEIKMGGGRWTRNTFDAYSARLGRAVDATGNVHTTPSRTGTGDISEMLKSICGEYNLECCYVTRTYMTRHGAGPFETECGIAKINAEIRDLTNVYNVHQGHIRYGTIDADKLFERIAADYAGIKGKNTVLSAAVTHMNETDGKFAAQSADKFGEFIQKFDRVYFSDKKTRDGVRRFAVNPRTEQ